MGYFARPSLLADAVHYVRTTQMARALVACATNDVERAYAWGWVSHVIADIMIHPLINKAAGRWNRQDRPLSFADNPSLHLRIELGLDAHFHVSGRVEEIVRCQFLDENNMFSKAILATYGKAFTHGELLACHRNSVVGFRRAVRWSQVIRRQQSLALQPVHWEGDEQGIADSVDRDLVGSLLFAMLKFMSGIRHQSTLYAITHPIPADDHLLGEVAEMTTDVATEFYAALSGKLDEMDNFNLDLGIPSRETMSYPPTRVTLELLQERVGSEESSGR